MQELSSIWHRDAADDVATIPDAGASEVRLLDFSGALDAQPSIAPSMAMDAGRAAAASLRDDASALSDGLAALSFGDRAFLLRSGPEAWRAAAETIRRHHKIAGRPKRRRLIFCIGPAADDGAPPGLEGDGEIAILRADDLGGALAEINPTTAGFVIAPVRTRNGLEIVGGGLLVGLREAADEYGLVLAFDETFCGLGRSGMIWAHEWTGVTPDLMILTQGLAGALPLAALVATQKVARGGPAGLPAPDPAAVAAGRVMMETVAAPGFDERVQSRTWYFEDRLAALAYERKDVFRGTCGVGLMQGLISAQPAAPIVARLARRGLLARDLGSVLGLFPPLTVEESEIDAAVRAIAMACADDPL